MAAQANDRDLISRCKSKQRLMTPEQATFTVAASGRAKAICSLLLTLMAPHMGGEDFCARLLWEKTSGSFVKYSRA